MRLNLEALEARENPSGPTPYDGDPPPPPVTPPPPPPVTPPPLPPVIW